MLTTVMEQVAVLKKIIINKIQVISYQSVRLHPRGRSRSPVIGIYEKNDSSDQFLQVPSSPGPDPAALRLRTAKGQGREGSREMLGNGCEVNETIFFLPLTSDVL